MPKSPQDRKSAWKKSKFTDLECPSGQLCQVKRPGVQGLVRAGILDSMDTLTSIVSLETIPKAKGEPAKDPGEELLKDPQKMLAAFDMMDKVVMYVVVQPPVHPVPDNDDDRDEDLVYVDDIDIEDKSFIMNFAIGGSSDLEQFRANTGQAMGGVSAR